MAGQRDIVQCSGLRWVAGPTTGWPHAEAPYGWAAFIPIGDGTDRRVAGWANSHDEAVRRAREALA